MRSRREIREELGAELASEAPDSERVEKLTAELEAARRVWRRRRRDTATKARAAEEPTAAPSRGLTDEDRAAIATWPPELRAGLRTASMSRKIDRGSSVNDPNNWGALNDARRWRGPWS